MRVPGEAVEGVHGCEVHGLDAGVREVKPLHTGQLHPRLPLKYHVLGQPVSHDHHMTHQIT